MQFFKNYIKKDYLEEPYLKTDPNGKEYIKDKTSFEVNFNKFYIKELLKF